MTKVVRLLTDPVPQLVSMVEHGANQTPFLAVKSAEGGSDMAKRNTVAKAIETRADLHKIVFSGPAYASEEAVKSYLDERSYKGYAVAAEGQTFVVKGLDADKFDGKIRQIKAADGVMMHVGTLKADAAPQETVDKTAKNDPFPGTLVIRGATNPQELTQKWADWRAEWSEATTIADALEAGEDGLPPGIWEMNCAFYAALKNIFSADDDVVTDKPAKVTALCAEFATYINALQAVLEMKEMSTKVSKAASLFALQREPVAKAENVNIRVTFNDSSTQENDERAQEIAAPAILPAATGSVNGPGEVDNTQTNTVGVGDGIATTGTAPNGPNEIAAKAAETPAEGAASEAAPAETAAKAPEGEVQSIAPAAEPAPANDIASVLKAMTDGFKHLSEALTTQATEQKAALAKVEETVAKTAERVDAVENRATSRKSAADAGTAPSTVQVAKEADKHSLVLRGNLIGRSRRPGR